MSNRSGQVAMEHNGLGIAAVAAMNELKLNRDMNYIQHYSSTSPDIEAIPCYMKCAVRWVKEAWIAGSLAFAYGFCVSAAKDNVPAKCVGFTNSIINK